jgi:hypothetical protein
LDKRKRYRETGLIEKEPNHRKPYYESVKKKEFLELYKKEKEKEQKEQP